MSLAEPQDFLRVSPCIMESSTTPGLDRIGFVRFEWIEGVFGGDEAGSDRIWDRIGFVGFEWIQCHIYLLIYKPNKL